MGHKRLRPSFETPRKMRGSSELENVLIMDRLVSVFEQALGRFSWRLDLELA
jgi:hypothetical protein